PGFGKGGTGTLTVDGKQVAQGKIERTIPVRISLDETFDIGEDTGTPVVEDYVDKMPFKFTGIWEEWSSSPVRVGLPRLMLTSFRNPTGGWRPCVTETREVSGPDLWFVLYQGVIPSRCRSARLAVNLIGRRLPRARTVRNRPG